MNASECCSLEPIHYNVAQLNMNWVHLQLNVFMQALYALCMQSKVVQHRNL